MRFLNKIYISKTLAIVLFSNIILSIGCKQEVININKIDEKKYDISESTKFFIEGQDGKRSQATIDIRQIGNYNISLKTNKITANAVSGELIYDESLVSSYNNENNTSFIPYPKDLISLENDGKLDIQANNNTSDYIKISIKSQTNSISNGVVPLKLKVSGQDEQLFFLFVKDLSNIPSTDKASGIKIISCMEINDTNPLNNLSLKLKNSNKQLIDMVILFSSNINYDEQKGITKLTHNQQMTAILHNKEKYIKPLRDKGIKVILSVLGNHDRAGVANLSSQSAKEFAQEIKKTCEAYDLDGVFFDDEYSAYQTPVPMGFVAPSRNAAARLVYETKQAMPDKITMVYVYGRTDNFGGSNAIAEATAGQYVDYALHDYRQGFDLTSAYPGLPKTRWAMYSGEYNLNRYPTVNNLNTLKNGGYGAHMIFAFDPNRSNLNTQTTNLRNIASYLFSDELVIDQSNIYKKDY